MTLPADLRFRDVAVRVVAEACRLVVRTRSAHGSMTGLSATTSSTTLDLSDRFAAEMVSAVSEIFNNIAIHAYQRRGVGDVELTILVEHDALTVEIRDHGQPFDLGAVPAPELDALPEGGMGIHIARALLDVVDYEPGPPNLWRLVKRMPAQAERKSSAK